MAPHQAQRTLVKSRPELWAEVSDVESLCKHLGEFGEITITRLEPETTVAWEGTAARGTVELEASGWGTKVTLTAELTAPGAGAPDPVAVAAPDPEPAPEPVAVVPEPDVVVPEPEVVVPEPVAVSEPEAVAVEEPAPVAAAIAPAPKVGFFARVFGRKAAAAPVVPAGPTPAERAAARNAARAAAGLPVAETPATTSLDIPVPVVEAPADPPPPLRIVPDPEPDRVVPLRRPEPEEDDEPYVDPDPPLVASAPAAKVLDGEQAVALLTGVLDDLGAAHRRPFSHG